METKNEKVLKAKVKKDGREIEVYKTENGTYNIFFGDKLTFDKIQKKEHFEVFKKEDLIFI